MAIAEFLTSGGYNHHLRSIRGIRSRQVAQMRDAVGRYFPPGTRVTNPLGGFILWVDIPERVDALALCDRALREGIGIAPGPLFGTTGSVIGASPSFATARPRRWSHTNGRVSVSHPASLGDNVK